MNLTVQIGKTTFSNPVTVASGTFAHAEKYYNLEEVKKLGALTLKTITLHPREGNSPPRIVETPAGMLNAIGIENPGVERFLAEKWPAFVRIGVPLIVSILGHSDEEFEQLAARLNEVDGISALELNLSCPNLQQKRLVAQDPLATERIVRKVKTIVSMPVVAKLSPNVTDISEIASAAEAGGADGLCLINTLSGMVINTRTRSPVLGNRSGGLSGPAIRPVALQMVYQVARNVRVPIIAMGGIENADDALQFIMAGATMVAIGTMNFVDPRTPLAVLAGIKSYLVEHKIEDIHALKGSVSG